MSGTEDQPIALDIETSLTDRDGSETLGAITISNVPEGATLSAGADNGDGTWTLTEGQLDGLTVTPPADFSGDFQLDVAVDTVEADGDTATAETSFIVSVEGDADAPTLTANDVTGDEDTAIALDIDASLTDTDGSETLNDLTIAGVPEGATLSNGIDNGDGTWTIAPDQLDGLTVTPPSDFSGEFDLTVTATSTEADGDTAQSVRTFTVDVTAIADEADITANDASGLEDAAIALDVSAAITDTSGSESLGDITIGNVPNGASLSAGVDNGDGTWTLTPAQLDGLTVTPPSDFSGEFDLSVTAETIEDSGETRLTTESLTVSVEGVADAPTLNVSDASGDEDAAIALDIAPELTDTDGSESLTITVSNMPQGATLNAGVDNGDGTWTLTPAQLDGLAVTPPEDFSGEFDLTVSATSAEADGDTSTVAQTLTVSVEGVVDAPEITANNVSGVEDTPIALDVSAALADTDGSETLGDVTIAGVPQGASLSAGVNNGDGTWTLSPEQLDGLTVTPPSDFAGEFDLSVTTSATESNGQTVEASETFTVSVEGAADAPELSTADVRVGEDHSVPLDISAGLTDTDGSESLAITVAGVPDGATLSNGVDNGDGTWSLSPDDLTNLRLTPAADDSSDFTLTVTATASEDGDTESVTSSFDVDVVGIADVPELDVAPATGLEDTAIALDIASALTDTDGSETLSITISNVPNGAEFNTGVNNGDGSWTFTPAQLEGLTVTPPQNFAGEFDLTVTATATEAEGNIAVSNASLTVTVEDVPDDTGEESEEPVADEPAPVDPNAINWEGGEELNVISDSGDIDETLDRIEFQADSLTEPGISVDDGTDLGYEMIGAVPPLEVESEPVDSVPPPSEPLYELVETQNADEQGGQRAPAPSDAPSATASDEPAQTFEPAKKTESQLANVFGMLWGLVRSIGPRQNTDEKDN